MLIRVSSDNIYTSISLNGADNVGKSTMINYMPMNDIEIRSSVSNYDNLLNDLKKKNNLKEWFFTKSTHEELIKVIMHATNKRADIIPKSNTKFVIYDRGSLMCEAMCIAIIACKEKCDLIQAATIYNSIIEKYGIHIPLEDIRILLKHGYCLEDSLEISLMRECEHDQLYDEYQMLLQKQLLIQELNNQYTDVINVTDMSVIQVQNQIRTIIRNSCLSLCIETATHFNPMFEHVNIIIGFDGSMSESEESILAEGTCRKLESAGVTCQRLQIQYFMELASNELDSNVNQLVKQLDHYLKRHYWIAAVTIESCHRLGCIQSLKKILGDLLQICYIDITSHMNLQHSTANIGRLYSKDLVKSSYRTNFTELINDIYEFVEQKCEKIQLQALLNQHYSTKINLFSHQFLFNVGSIIIQKSTHEVCLMHHLDDKDEWFLPKGQKNINETLSATAVRVTFEETGYHCSLMPLMMEAKATSRRTTSDHLHDSKYKIGDISQPLTISLHQIETIHSNQKIIFWYVTQIDEQFSKQIIKKNTEAKLVSLDEVNQLLLQDDEKGIVRKAFELFQNTYTLP